MIGAKCIRDLEEGKGFFYSGHYIEESDYHVIFQVYYLRNLCVISFNLLDSP